MLEQKQFGRRVNVPQAARAAPGAAARPTVARTPLQPTGLSAARLARSLEQRQADPVDRELEEWKKARRQNFRLPWRQLAFLASIFFGIASLVLTETVNDNVQWVLYALMAASLVAGLTARRRKATA